MVALALILTSGWLNADDVSPADVKNGVPQNRLEAPKSDEVVVTGIVLKADGTPAAGATIRSAAPVTQMLERRLGRPFVSKMVETVADDHGQFTISVSKTPYRGLGDLEPQWLDQWKATVIAATLTGFGPAWIEYADIPSDKPLTLQLVEDLPIRGQVVDLEGNPYRGTAIRVVQLQQSRDGNLDRVLLDNPQVRRPLVLNQPIGVRRNFGLREIDPRLIGLHERIITNDEGVFQIQNVGKERLIHLDFVGGDVSYRTAVVVSRDTKPLIQARIAELPGAPPPEPIYGADFKLAISPSRPIEGTVVDAKTEKPLAGFSVEISSGGQLRPVRHVMRATTDSAGRFRLLGLSKDQPLRNRIVAFPPKEEPYFPRTMAIPETPGLDPIEIKIEVHRGIWIKGQVTNGETHQPISGLRVHYYPYQSNDSARSIPAFQARNRQEGDHDLYATGSDGSYQVVGLPGQGVVAVENELLRFVTGVGFDQIAAGRNLNGLAITQQLRGPSTDQTFVIRDVNPGADDQEAHLDLEVEPGVSTRIRVVDREGQAVPGTGVFGAGVTYMASKADGSDDAIAIIEHLNPNGKHQMQAHHRDRRLGLSFQIEPPYDRVITIVIEPLAVVKGRLLEAGEPLARTIIMPAYKRTDTSGQMLPGIATSGSFVTNASGAFECQLIPGFEYQIRARGPGAPFNAGLLAEDLKLKAGETVDLGDFELTQEGFRPVKKEKQTE